MTTTFENAQVGDRVYSLIEGWVTIKAMYKGSKKPVCAGTHWYKLDGYYADGDGGMQILYWDVPEIITPKQTKQAPPVDTLVEVILADMTTLRRYSSGKFDDNGRLMCYQYGATSKTADSESWSAWDKWLIVEDADKC